MSKIKAPDTAWQMKLFPVLTLLGWVLIGTSFVIGLFVLTPTAASYWGGNAKAARDAAVAGSVLLGQQGTLTTIPRWLVPLTFLGAASFIVGIALEFSSIPALLKNRGQVMSACFPYIAKQDS